MMTIGDVRDALNYSEAEWNSLRKEIQRHLPHGASAIQRIDRSYVRMWRYLERAALAERQGRKYPALWWYTWLRAINKDTAKKIETLGESGLSAQKKARELNGS